MPGCMERKNKMISILLTLIQESKIEYSPSLSCDAGIISPYNQPDENGDPDGTISAATLGNIFYPGPYFTAIEPGPTVQEGDLHVWFASFDQSLFLQGQELITYPGSDHHCIRRFGDPYFVLGAGQMYSVTGWPIGPFLPDTAPAIVMPNDVSLVGVEIIIQPVVFSVTVSDWIFADAAFKYTVGTFNPPVSQPLDASYPCTII
jgi:hypothetical protein